MVSTPWLSLFFRISFFLRSDFCFFSINSTRIAKSTTISIGKFDSMIHFVLSTNKDTHHSGILLRQQQESSDRLSPHAP